MPAPLIVTRDQDLLERLLRVAAAAGVEPEVEPSAASALRRWVAASVVLVGLDLVAELVAAGPPRRPGLHLVAGGRVPDLVFRSALELGAQAVVELPRSESWLVEVLTDAGEPRAAGVTIGVVGGAGGSGASTLACALGLVAAARSPACLVDADPLGAGLDRVLGMEAVDGIRWDALEHTTGRLGARALREALPCRRGLGVLTWAPGPRGTLQAFAARSALEAAARGHDLVVVDLPRGAGGTLDELMARCDRVLVVSRGGVPALAATARMVARAAAAGEVLVALRGRGPDDRELSRLVGARVVVRMPDQRGLDEAVDLGLGPVRSRRGALAHAAAQVLDALPSGASRTSGRAGGRAPGGAGGAAA